MISSHDTGLPEDHKWDNPTLTFVAVTHYTTIMTYSQILRAQDFSVVAEVRADDKRRVPLKRARHAGRMYRVYENSLGQIILDPVVTIPASEAWLFDNKPALSSVRKGLKESGEGKVVKLPSLAKHAADEPD